MSTTIDQAFVKQFEREVHESYQRMGSKLKGTVRSKNDVQGSSTVFQRVGKGTASVKSRHGSVPVMNLDHSNVEVTLHDYYAGDWIDRLDELKLNMDERSVISNAGAYALGRKTDDLIISALATGTVTTSTNTDGLTKAKVLEAFGILGGKDVPDDGNRFAIVGYKQWSDLLSIDEFANADYIGDDELPWKGTQAKRFLGILFMPHSGLPINTTTGVRKCFMYHKTAIGHAAGSDVQTDISWHGDKAAHFVNNMMSQGAGLIDNNGVVVMECDETP